jgi:hypothetical protein
MRLAFILFFFLTLTSCKEIKKTQKPDFLIGNWIRMHQPDSIKTYEKWDVNLKGIGLTLRGKDTTFYEKLEIVTKNDTLFLKVTGVNERPTFFKFTSQTKTSFTAENPENEFPKLIKYYLEHSILKAKVASDDFSIGFEFEKI